MDVFRILNPYSTGGLLFTCEHASCAIPGEYGGLGLLNAQIVDHIGWDIGAAELTGLLAAEFDAPAVLSGVSRLVIDCNRAVSDHDLIVTVSDGVRIPGNAEVDQRERARRIRECYDPYHNAVDSVIARRRPLLLLSIHSFTSTLNGRERPYDAGVLFDSCAAEAERLGAALGTTGLTVRYNEPYSGLDGLIFSANHHGRRYGLRYLELELNNRLLREEASIRSVAVCVSTATRVLLES